MMWKSYTLGIVARWSLDSNFWGCITQVISINQFPPLFETCTYAKIKKSTANFYQKYREKCVGKTGDYVKAKTCTRITYVHRLTFRSYFWPFSPVLTNFWSNSIHVYCMRGKMRRKTSKTQKDHLIWKNISCAQSATEMECMNLKFSGKLSSWNFLNCLPLK